MSAQPKFLPLRRPVRIGLTPLIDVVFILLMFFMLTSTFTKFKAVSLVAPVQSASVSELQPVHVVVSSSMALYRLPERKPLGHDQLARVLEAGTPIILSAEPEVSVQDIVTTLRQLKSAGASKVNIGQPFALGGL